jgi:hypothetical protein
VNERNPVLPPSASLGDRLSSFGLSPLAAGLLFAMGLWSALKAEAARPQRFMLFSKQRGTEAVE